MNKFFSYSSVLTYVLGSQKNRLLETVLLSTHNICFGWEARNIYFWYELLTKDQIHNITVQLDLKELMHKPYE